MGFFSTTLLAFETFPIDNDKKKRGFDFHRLGGGNFTSRTFDLHVANPRNSADSKCIPLEWPKSH